MRLRLNTVSNFTNLFMLVLLAILASSVHSKEAATSQNAICPILIGETIPNVTLINSKGKKANLHEVVKAAPTLFIFYRGSWCPYCNTHLANLRKIESELLDMGIQIIAISPDKPKYLNVTLDKQKLAYTLLSDSKVEAAKAFGLAYKVDGETLTALKGYNINLKENSGENHELLPVPAAILVNTDLKVNFVFAAPDYTVRVDNSVILAAAKTMTAKQEKK